MSLSLSSSLASVFQNLHVHLYFDEELSDRAVSLGFIAHAFSSAIWRVDNSLQENLGTHARGHRNRLLQSASQSDNRTRVDL